MTILRDYVSRIRPPKRPVYLKLHFAPGELRMRADLMAYASGAWALCREFFESDDRPVHFVQIRPASQAEW